MLKEQSLGIYERWQHLQNMDSTDVKECDGVMLLVSGFGLGGDKG